MATSQRDASTPFLAAADRLVDELLPMWEGSNNVWRAGWVLDTLVDYFMARGEDGSIIQNPLLPVSPTKNGDWWDDFAWVGIATLRAAEMGIFPKQRNELVKAAINAWTYMHGPGWSRKPTNLAFPFKDLEGWQDFDPSADRRIGAPNAWANIRDTWSPGEPTARQIGERKPRYAPGGVWNAPIRDPYSPDVVAANPGCTEADVALAPIQNTVTNGLFAILSLRLALAGAGGAYRDLFEAADLNLAACQDAWTNQWSWFMSWIYDTYGEESLALTISPTRFLVRERVSTFHEYEGRRAWDGGYCSRLAWTGDQGLLLGFLREVERAGGTMPQRGTGAYRLIVSTVFERAYAPRRYFGSGAVGMFLLPWLRLGDDNPYGTSPPGGSDYGDYQTGNGVFMRYLLQAYRADPTVVDGYAPLVIGAAKQMTEKSFGESVYPPGCCDAYVSIDQCGDHRPANQMTPLVNRLAVLLMAHEMTSGEA
ncbi:hypothetical protein [Oleiagrimonas soli]|uniref:Uncharacterized protein n=1 Tax=Oleiagrimonas soli TaxID=1543381 RepID=A0A099CWG5_9GAMM|nr:hypothetical protein [Oleiagrimonas soli]KGI78064.1 hypothetical protein LF63_0106755 [Oleiagrimonas soli]MBB6183528.1 hypothetical protein [Oleiagrimonas soli]